MTTKIEPNKGAAPLTSPMIAMEARDLLRACKRAAAFVGRTSIPVLGTMRVEVKNGQATFTATNLDAKLEFTMPARGGGGAMLLPVKPLIQRLSGVNTEVIYVLEGSKAVGRTKTMVFRDETQPVSDFPTFELGVPIASMIVNFDKLGWAFQQTECAISTEETRYYLNGVYMAFCNYEGRKAVRFVATDGHRLNVCTLPECKPLLASEKLDRINAIIPRLACETILRIARQAEPDDNDDLVDNITVRQHLKAVVFEGPGWEVATKMIDGTYPDWQRVIPTTKERETRIEVDADALADALHEVAKVSSTKTPVAIKLSPGTSKIDLKMCPKDGDEGSATVEAKMKGKPLTFGMNTEYLLDALDLVEKRAVIHVASHGPLTITDPDEPDFLQVVMPHALSTTKGKPLSEQGSKNPAQASPKAQKQAPATPAPAQVAKAPSKAPRASKKAPGKAPSTPAQQPQASA